MVNFLPCNYAFWKPFKYWGQREESDWAEEKLLDKAIFSQIWTDPAERAEDAGKLLLSVEQNRPFLNNKASLVILKEQSFLLKDLGLIHLSLKG